MFCLVDNEYCFDQISFLKRYLTLNNVSYESIMMKYKLDIEE
jgi:hypothetical protein